MQKDSFENRFEDVENKRSLTLIVTERCDLNCVYCYEHDKTARQMSFETAKKIIDQELLNLDKYQYQIEFFGGEPFLNFELIRSVVEYVISNYKGCYNFFATTNGTQVHGEIQQWLIKHREIFTVGLSLDGNKKAHDVNRSNSFDKIDFDFFLKYYPQQTIKMTISDLSLPYLYESVKELTEKGFLISCNLAYMIDWLAEKNKQILIAQLEKLIEYYLENPKVKKCSMMDFNLSVLAHDERDSKTATKYCGCGTNIRCYGVDGECYPCQLFSPLSAGSKAIKADKFYIGREFSKKLLKSECQDCYFRRICPICLGSNYLSTGDMFQIDKDRCELYKLIFKANAKLKALEWEKGNVDINDEQGLLRSLLKINEI